MSSRVAVRESPTSARTRADGTGFMRVVPFAEQGYPIQEGSMIERRTPYGFGCTVDLPFPEAAERTRRALAAEGFGILCEIDVAATLREKLGVEMPPYIILGACNPPLAHRALTAEPDIGLLLPCNVVVYATKNSDRTVVTAIDPTKAMRLSAQPALEPLAAQVARKLAAALEKVADGDASAMVGDR